MLVKACLNGSRRPGEHPALPLSPDDLATDAAACARAGAGAVHVHPRDAQGRETLDGDPCGDAVRAIRAAVPGLAVGLSTGAWIEPVAVRRAAIVGAWNFAPDFASVNVYEEGADEVAAALAARGIGVEAGPGSVEDARRLVAGALGGVPLLRVLIEPAAAGPDQAVEAARAMDDELERGGLSAPRLHHGEGRATWAVLRAAAELGRDIRVGFEDTLEHADGAPARDNAALVDAAVELTCQDPA